MANPPEDNILALWNDAQERGLNKREHAESLGIPITAYYNRFYRAESKARTSAPLPESRYPRWDTPPKISGNALILGDLHIPYHHAPFVNNCIGLAKAWGVKQAILGGDALDAHAFSHWPDDVKQEGISTISTDAEAQLLALADTLSKKDRAKLLEKLADMNREPENMADELKESRKALRALAGAFDKVLWFTGNHEARIVKRIEKALPAAEIAQLFGMDDPRWTFSGYYRCDMESAGIKYRITHPKNSGKGSSKRLVPKFGAMTRSAKRKPPLSLLVAGVFDLSC